MTNPQSRARKVLAAAHEKAGETGWATCLRDPTFNTGDIATHLAAMQTYADLAVAEERERCARMAEDTKSWGWHVRPEDLAGAIRNLHPTEGPTS